MQSISYAEFRAMRRFPALDGLRAIAAVMVFAFHFGGPGWRWLSGWIGVHMFFVLSGFLITTLLLREEDRRGRISLRAFYLRRAFRILPVYFVVLAATYALAHVTGSGEQVRKSLIHYVFLLNEFAPTTGFIHSWTIAIEQKFYLFWPMIAFVVVSGAFRKRIAITATAIVCLAALIPLATTWPYWPIHYLVILVGCLLAIIMHNPRGYALVRPLTHPVTATVVAVGFVGAHFAMRYWPPAEDGHAESLLAAYAVAVAALLPALLSRSLPAKVLTLRPMVFVGERSYSLYLVQFIAAKTVAGLAPSFPHHGTKVFLTVVAVGLLAADLLYRWVEQPMIDLGRRLAVPGRKPDREATAASVTETPAEAGALHFPAQPAYASEAAST